MKAVLFLCLFALFTCSIDDVIGTVKCVVRKPKVQELGLKLFSYLYTKDYDKILPAVLGSLPDLFQAVTECVSQKVVNDDDVVLKDNSVCPHWVKYLLCTTKCKLLDSDCCQACFDQNCK